MIAISFIGFLILFVVIGGLSVLKSHNTTEDYLLANKSVPPWLAGLSAVATTNSGFMFIAMIGFTYTTGLSSIWMMFGWIIGDFIASLIMVRKIRETSGRTNIQSFGHLLSSWQGTDYPRVRYLAGILIILFLGTYAAAQFKAGAKAMEVFLDWTPWLGILIGSLIVLIYSMAGGIRASIWTDAAQSIVMLIGMVLLVIAGVSVVGSPAEIIAQLSAVKPNYMHWLPDKPLLEMVLFLTGWLFGGIAVMGQPHIIVRYMSVDSPAHINRMRFYYYTWYILFYTATIIVGLLSRIVLAPSTTGFHPEQALPMMAVTLLPEVAAGLILAAIFAATMSTADSLVLSCSATITQDLISPPSHNLWFSKLATAGVVLVALLIALSDNQSVFQLVLMAWGLLASAFLPLLFLYTIGERCSEPLALVVMLSGIGVFLAWRFLGLGGLVYEVMPGILSGLIVFYSFSRLGAVQKQ